MSAARLEFLFRDAAVVRFYKHDSPFTYFTSNDLHLGEISLECSRAGAAAAALWTTLKCFPLDATAGLGAVLRKNRQAALVLADLIESSADVFQLDRDPALRAKLVALERWGEKSVDNLFAELAARRAVAFARFLVALAIGDVGPSTGKLLANHFKTFDELVSATEDELQHIDGIGPEVATRVVQWFANDVNRAFVARLFAGGVEIRYPVRGGAGGFFAGQTVVFTGTLESLGRAEAKQIVEDQGGKVASSVSAKTNFLVIGGSPGSKAKKAEELGVKVLLEPEFLAKIGRAS